MTKSGMILEPNMYVNQPHIVIVTGYSGAGKSSVLKALEDSGFLCIDNLPIALLDSFFRLVAQTSISNLSAEACRAKAVCQEGTPGPDKRRGIALGLDVRSDSTMELLKQELHKVGSSWQRAIKIIFVTSSDAVLVKRFQETRRKHPLAQSCDLLEAIAQEKVLMNPLKMMADIIVDTDQLTIHQLRKLIHTSFAAPTTQRISVSLVSFGFKYGVPPESNFVFDVSSLPNPYFVPELKPLTGIDQPIQNYLFALPEVVDYWKKARDFVRFAIERSYQEGRLFITIAIGCTGGRHRSVAFVQRLAQEVVPHAHFLVKHRDIAHDSEQYTNKPD
jgi:UPF0042 nucleotide-binding protein